MVEELQDYNIAVGVPCTDVWIPQFGLSLAAFASYFGMARLERARSQRLHILSSQGSMLPQLRENLVLSALKVGASHLLMLDSDMKFPRDIIHQWLPKNVSILAANCATKRIPAEATAVGFNGERIYSDEQAWGLVKVESVGTAVMLVRLDVFQKIPRPWFMQEWQGDIQHFCGEDRYFCRKAQKHGFDVFIDHDVSKKIGHMGLFEYGHDVVGEVVREPIKEERNVKLAV